MHGPNEVQEDIRQLCARKYYSGKWMNYVLAYNANIKADWKPAAIKAGLAPEKLAACVTSGEGKALLSESIKTSRARNARNSPTIYINGKAYTGGRGVKSFTLAICSALKARGQQEPEACRKALLLPDEPAAAGGGNGCGDAAPVKFNVRIVTEGACSECEPTLMDAIKQKHPAAVISKVEASSPEGKALIAEHGASSLPLYILGKEVEQEKNFPAFLGSFYGKSGGGYIIKSRPDTYTPSIHLDRALNRHHMDIFVDPLSPLTAKAEDELFTVLRYSKFKDLTFSMHFLVWEGVKADSGPVNQKAENQAEGIRSASLKEMAEVSAGPLTSAQGAAGVQESLLQACLFQHASFGNYLSYLFCRNSDLMDNNRAGVCLEQSDVIKKCVEGGKGERLLRQDAKTVRELGVKTSGAVLWENRYGPFEWNKADLRRLVGAGK